MPSGKAADTESIIDYINSRFHLNGMRPTHQEVADHLGIQRATVAKVVAVNADTGRIDGEPRKAGRIGADRRLETLQFIRTYALENGWAPSQREIARNAGCSVNTINSVIAKLAADGLIEMGPHPRQIRITGSVMKVPEVTL